MNTRSKFTAAKGAPFKESAGFISNINDQSNAPATKKRGREPFKEVGNGKKAKLETTTDNDANKVAVPMLALDGPVIAVAPAAVKKAATTKKVVVKKQAAKKPAAKKAAPIKKVTAKKAAPVVRRKTTLASQFTCSLARAPATYFDVCVAELGPRERKASTKYGTPPPPPPSPPSAPTPRGAVLTFRLRARKQMRGSPSPIA
jgi:hypothetical protein